MNVAAKTWDAGRPTVTDSTLLKTGPGVLHGITINTTAAAAVTVYDGISAAGPATTLAVFPASAGIGTYTYDVAFVRGLFFVLAGASDITVAYA